MGSASLILTHYQNFISGISGRVTYQGNPRSGIPVELRLWNGSSFSTTATTTTQANGYYQFNSAPSLGSGQTYYVGYFNSTDSTYVSYCAGSSLYSYTVGDAVAGGSFDITNIPQVSPPMGSNVALPSTFRWTARAGMPSDGYFFELWKPDNSYWWSTSNLGYVSQYTLNSLPTPSFSINTEYYWDVGVFGADGSVCFSYTLGTVTFH